MKQDRNIWRGGGIGRLRVKNSMMVQKNLLNKIKNLIDR